MRILHIEECVLIPVIYLFVIARRSQFEIETPSDISYRLRLSLRCIRQMTIVQIAVILESPSDAFFFNALLNIHAPYYSITSIFRLL